MDLSKLSTADKVISISAIVLFIGSFLPWFKVEVTGGGFGGGVADGNGWDVGFLWAGIPVLLGLAMLTIIAIRAFSPDTSLPDLPVTWGQAFLGAGALAALLVVLKLLIGEDDGGFGDIIEVKRAFGLYLSTLAALGLAAGGFLKMQEDDGTAGSTSAGPPQTF